jgi:hypothetical protein
MARSTEVLTRRMAEIDCKQALNCMFGECETGCQQRLLRD